mmetsp:Transcript_8501/g.26359  ORF Transcript_8501/g.26359 Transcript_8501/m.26359 type:complete len:272 (+) Transcript_8501:1391-2206(+)
MRALDHAPAPTLGGGRGSCHPSRCRWRSRMAAVRLGSSHGGGAASEGSNGHRFGAVSHSRGDHAHIPGGLPEGHGAPHTGIAACCRWNSSRGSKRISDEVGHRCRSGHLDCDRVQKTCDCARTKSFRGDRDWNFRCDCAVPLSGSVREAVRPKTKTKTKTRTREHDSTHDRAHGCGHGCDCAVELACAQKRTQSESLPDEEDENRLQLGHSGQKSVWTEFALRRVGVVSRRRTSTRRRTTTTMPTTTAGSTSANACVCGTTSRFLYSTCSN